MSKHNSAQLNAIKAQIRDMQSAMNVGGSMFSLIYAADHFRSMFLLSGIFSLLFPLVYHVLLLIYDTSAQIPQPVMILFYSALFLGWCAVVAVRTRASVRAAKALGMQSSVWAVIRQILSTRMWLAILPVLLVLVLLPVKFAQLAAPRALAAYGGVVLGLVLNLIGVMIREREYSACGLWMIISGAACLFLFSLPVHIALAAMLAPACFLFVLVNSVTRKHRERQDAIE